MLAWAAGKVFVTVRDSHSSLSSGYGARVHLSHEESSPQMSLGMFTGPSSKSHAVLRCLSLLTLRSGPPAGPAVLSTSAPPDRLRHPLLLHQQLSNLLHRQRQSRAR